MGSRGPKPRPKVALTCAQCGTAFEVWPSGAKNGRAFCSNACKTTARRGEGHPRYKTGRFVLPNGYVTVPVPGRGRVYEHRLVVERRIGRPLTRDERVHHVNHDRGDNRDENLMVVTKKQHARIHADETLRGGWSRVASECIDCGRTDRKHEARGRCYLCNRRLKAEQGAHD
jgi:hypothetical protein